MIKNINLGVIGIDHGHIFDMLDEMLKEGCSCNHFWTKGSPLTLKEFNKNAPADLKAVSFKELPEGFDLIKGHGPFICWIDRAANG